MKELIKAVGGGILVLAGGILGFVQAPTLTDTCHSSVENTLPAVVILSLGLTLLASALRQRLEADAQTWQDRPWTGRLVVAAVALTCGGVGILSLFLTNGRVVPGTWSLILAGRCLDVSGVGLVLITLCLSSTWALTPYTLRSRGLHRFAR